MKSLQRAEGFTLLEVLIALVIIGGALLTVIHSLSYHLSQIERHEIITKAVLYGERVLKDETIWKAHNGKYSPDSSTEEDSREFSLSTRTIETEVPGLILREVTVRKGPEEITLRRLVRQ
jgi:prepilin-type N-terminal cleavage/methylation domain-containing protein